MKLSLAALRSSSIAWLALLAACTAPTGAPSTASEPSVRPGVNTEYLKPDIDVAEWTERFEHEGREVYDQRERIAEVAGVRSGMRVADIGPGTGLFTLLFAERVGAQGRVLAVDIVPAFLANIAKRAAEAGHANVTTVLCTERSVELEPESIDLAFVCDTYHHFEYPRSSLASIHAALRPDGELVVIDFVRVPGHSSDWVLEHVRAGEEVFAAEIEAAGFEFVDRPVLLRDNYILRFRKIAGR